MGLYHHHLFVSVLPILVNRHLHRTNFKTPFGCGRLQSPWNCVVGENGSRRTSVRLRALFTSGLAHRLFARPRFKISFEMGSLQKENPTLTLGSRLSLAKALWLLGYK